jgi:hypothetical protein
MSKVQAVLFHKDKFNTKQARKWLKDNNFTPIKRVDITDKYRRYRIIQPDYKKYNYRTKKTNKNIDFIIQVKKGKSKK